MKFEQILYALHERNFGYSKMMISAKKSGMTAISKGESKMN